MRLLALSIKELAALLVHLKKAIDDDFRASGCEDSDIACIDVTIGADETGWSYQTGDNSFTGGAYHYKHWGVGILGRNSNCRQLAKELLNKIREQFDSNVNY